MTPPRRRSARPAAPPTRRPDRPRGAVPAGQRVPGSLVGPTVAGPPRVGQAARMVSLVEYTDPCCFWAWGAQPKIRRLEWRYGDRLGWRRVQGDLFLADWPHPDFGLAGIPQWYDNPEIRKGLIECHAGIAATPGQGQPFPARLDWCPTESSQMC